MKTRIDEVCRELGFTCHKLSDALKLIDYLIEKKSEVEVQMVIKEYGGDPLRVYPIPFVLSEAGIVEITCRGMFAEMRKCRINNNFVSQ